jgi:hypothetical protein
VVPHRREEPASYPAGRDRQPTRPFAALRRSPDSRLQSGYALLSSRIRRHFLILIAGLFRIASPEMFPEAEMLPHLICSRPMFIGGAKDEADQHGGA